MQIVTTNHVRHAVVSALPSDQRLAIDQLFYREYFRPLHDSCRELLKTRLHLVEGSALPQSFYDYLRHSLQERVQQDLWSVHQIDTSDVHGIYFPDEFPACRRPANTRASPTRVQRAAQRPSLAGNMDDRSPSTLYSQAETLWQKGVGIECLRDALA